MKTKILNILAAVGAVLGLCACDNALDPAPATNGQLRLSSLTVEVDDSETVLSRAGVDTDGFIVTVTNSEGEVRGNYTVAEMPEIITLPVGDYTVEVRSHQLQKAEWDHPYYYGSKEFSITDGEITEIGAITCKFSSLKVSVYYADDLKSIMESDCRVEVVANDEGRLEYTPTETRVGCFAVVSGSNSLVASFDGTVKGSPVHVVRMFNTVAPGQHYKLTFSLKTHPSAPDELGQIDLTEGVTIDLSVIDEDLNGNIDDEEEIIENPTRPGTDPIKPGEPENPDDPNPPVGSGEPTIEITSDDIDFDKPNSTDGEKYVVTIKSETGLTHLQVKIESTDKDFVESLPGMGVPTEFDLAYPGAYASSLGADGLGFPTGDEVIGQKEVIFDISQFVPLLGAFNGTHKFVLTVSDSTGTVTKTLTFVV